jgi:pyridinium-3,5-biscarboxylic acid mononucleotide synthase
MNKSDLTTLLRDVRSGRTDVETALNRLKHLPFEDVVYAHIDHHRHLRHGMPEVIYCEGKTLDQVVGIAKRMLKAGSDVLATRANEKIFKAVKKLDRSAVYHTASRAIVIQHEEKKPTGGVILALTAGTSDIPVAEEAAVTAHMLGSSVQTVYDVGVAGIHRVLSKRDILDAARVVIVVAGMDGALPSVVGGLVDKPVIAVPTSVGYGAGFQGLAPLLTMLNSCAAGVAVMNIDNGFGAGVLAHRINLLGEKLKIGPKKSKIISRKDAKDLKKPLTSWS